MFWKFPCQKPIETDSCILFWHNEFRHCRFVACGFQARHLFALKFVNVTVHFHVD